MADIELVKPHADGDFYHGAEFRNSWLAHQGAGVFHHTLTATVTESDMDITLPAITARVPDGSGGLVLVSYAGGTLTVTAADVSDPRVDIIVLDATGTASITAGTPTDESGDVEEAPLPSLNDDEILLARVRVEDGVTSILASKVLGRAIPLVEMGVAVSDTEPTNPYVGMLWADTSTATAPVLKIYAEDA